ncbi:ABC transporter ATP-binding protein [Aeromicrobium wangtongii]|uniref:ABC transporter ATP-binding protein n=1 Tax=Aeromicrobium wangtongii TaxID=2969247 RepID=UPI00201781F0|nr:ABC transporter ATP-binding protein [Aeromicrobium wangtongii]MCL3819848.1 ABC transporter ATP-binding protein [Aeromicrobium wangtongii]
MSSIIALEGVSKSYAGVPAVKSVDLQVTRGERLAIIGPNGAGKSTLFGTIAGEHRPTAGKVWFDGNDVTRARSSKRAMAGMSRTFQVARLMPSMTVRENVFMAALTGQHRGVRFWDMFSSHREVEKRVDVALADSNLEDLAGVSAAALAQGARKTLEMAMAIVQDPKILLLDEPTAGMGFEDARSATAQLKRLLDARPDMTIILTAHDMEVIHSLAERVVLMANGEVVLEGSPAEVASHETTKALYLGHGGAS